MHERILDNFVAKSNDKILCCAVVHIAPGSGLTTGEDLGSPPSSSHRNLQRAEITTADKNLS